MTAGDRRTVRVVIAGRVQGVWFRAWTEREARVRNLAGWVRNRRDGTVEAVFDGEGANVDEMLEECREGPPAARVDDVRIEDVDAAAVGLVDRDFHVLPTA